MGCSVTDTVHGDIDPTRMPVNDRGETKKVVDEVGWLRSGDIGVWMFHGRLKSAHRKTNIFKRLQA
ncbi:hypothetical protein SPRG_04143 [Saprolegnia parasitica CBS 223.65]|uniref:AMP-dependent synthetase/ligase domain-containing protein n=1 Tax=Saprolegnia parasitica (strain CBS 223.65) TaxID=695850 RepID=A0A067CNX2_SAPPC|nr:hypothetical protein SPRG_04143 [Saprolegnia parasitica CBS 223.65]KDO30955.1 hypothetical protein SPRG_04143 [Saprolegnia parasitica CBS 223.65]|eukprot:XP_012198139.1 hypothetical protein SPRG_04143 [Saprolegnia parasitica CBS 223.65]